MIILWLIKMIHSLENLVEHHVSGQLKVAPEHVAHKF